MFLDSHAHVDAAAFDDDRDDVLARARAAGVTALICIGSGADLATAERAIALAAREADIAATVGIHPHDTVDIQPGWWDALAALAASSHVVGVGETGLDFFYDHSPPDTQRACFRRFIDLARDVGRPVVCHVRDAHDEARAILAEHKVHEVGGVIHCFTGGPADARAYVDMGLHISFSGVVTFRGARNEPVRDAIAAVPDDRLLIETDCPYLAPEPLRGRRNEPAYLVHTAAQVATARGISVERLAELTTDNARRLFGLT